MPLHKPAVSEHMARGAEKNKIGHVIVIILDFQPCDPLVVDVPARAYENPAFLAFSFGFGDDSLPNSCWRREQLLNVLARCSHLLSYIAIAVASQPQHECSVVRLHRDTLRSQLDIVNRIESENHDSLGLTQEAPQQRAQ